jgi:P-type conjugative transfer protein TrbJ
MRRLTSPALGLAAALALSFLQVTAAEARIVFDPQNYAENLLQASRALEQIHNQIESLQNEARMLENMAKELTPLDDSSLQALTSALQGIETLIRQAEGISFDARQTREAIDRYYKAGDEQEPQAAQLLEDAEARWRQALSAYRTALELQSDIVGDIATDEGTLSTLVTQSEGAIGSLQAEQAGNQLLALSARQQLQIQALLAAQFRADALEKAREAKEEEAARATTQQFLGTGSAYTPH